MTSIKKIAILAMLGVMLFAKRETVVQADEAQSTEAVAVLDNNNAENSDVVNSDVVNNDVINNNVENIDNSDDVNSNNVNSNEVKVDNQLSKNEIKSGSNTININGNGSVNVKKPKYSVGNSIANYAVQFKGNRYVWGGTSLKNGTDCSGFTQSVYKKFGVSIPRTSRTQATAGKKVSIKNMKTGDLVFYAKRGTINHVAIYIGGGKVISASSPSTGIRISKYNYRTPVKAVRYN